MEQIIIPPVDFAVVAPLLTVFGWATVLLLVDVFFIPAKRKNITGYLALAGLIVAAAVAVPLWGISATTFSDMIALDTYGLTLTWIFLLIGGISILLAIDYLPRQGIEQGEFYPLIMFAVGGMILLGQATNLIVIFLGIELLSITLYILTGFAYPRLTSEEAAMKYLIMGAFAAGFFVYGIALVFGSTGTVDLFMMGEALAIRPLATLNQTLLLIGVGMIIVAFGFKVALVPFHMWTPDVYEGSPTPVAAFMSVGTKGAAFAALLRILQIALPSIQSFWLPVLGVLAAATMLVGNIGALGQTNVKRMLAYSSIGHAGYILLGVMSVSDFGTQAFLFYLLAYALTNLGAFAVVIVLEQREEANWSLDDFSGLYQRHPYLAIAMAFFMLSLAGVPMTAGFFGKFLIFSAAWEAGLAWLVLIGVITSAIAVFFYFRIVIRMFFDEPIRTVRPILFRGLNTGIMIALVGTILFGVLPTPVVMLVERSVFAFGN